MPANASLGSGGAWGALGGGPGGHPAPPGARVVNPFTALFLYCVV
jgi:hypothetical protein